MLVKDFIICFVYFVTVSCPKFFSTFASSLVVYWNKEVSNPIKYVGLEISYIRVVFFTLYDEIWINIEL